MSERGTVENKNYLDQLPNELHCLTVRQPWADLILGTTDTEGWKLTRLVEIRSWKPYIPTPFWLAIHAGSSFHSGEQEVVDRLKIESTFEKGMVLGIAEVYDIKELTPYLWEVLKPISYEAGKYPGGQLYFWRLRNQQRLEKSIPLKGRLGLFKIDKDLLRLVS